MKIILAVLLCSMIALSAPKLVNSLATSSRSLTTFTPDQLVKFSCKGSYLGYIFLGEENPANMCDISYPATTPGRFMMTKAKKRNTFSIKANCDGDGKFTSFLADNPADLIQPKRTAGKDTWVVTCPSAAMGCTIQASKSKKFLAPAVAREGGVTLSKTKVYWNAEIY